MFMLRRFVILGLFVSCRCLNIVKWEHDIRSKELLEKALESDADRLQSKINFGLIHSEETTSSDPCSSGRTLIISEGCTSNLKLEEFLQIINHSKAVRLDVDHDFVMDSAENILIPYIEDGINENQKLWIGLNVAKGPGTLPSKPFKIDDDFAEKFQSASLSLGWTKGLEDLRTYFTIDHMNDMIEIVSNINNTNFEFFMNAVPASRSKEAIEYLFSNVLNRKLVIQVKPEDVSKIDFLLLQEFANIDRIDLDMSEDLREKFTNSAVKVNSTFFILSINILLLLVNLL